MYHGFYVAYMGIEGGGVVDAVAAPVVVWEYYYRHLLAGGE